MVDRNAETLAEQLLTWPTSDRARLAALLIASLESSEPGVAAAWDEEITRRATELDAGTVSSIPATEVFAELDRRLGQLFREAVRIGLDRIMAQPEIGAVRRGTRRLVVDGFPYGIVYRSVDADLEVLALAHHRRRPWYWRRRV